MLIYSNPGLRFKKFLAQLSGAFDRVVAGHDFILGHELISFENSFADFIGVDHCVGVNSGTDALTLALKSLGLQNGDEVITTALTAHGTLVSIAQAGLTPVIVDIKTPNLCIDPDEVVKAINSKTRAIVPVHLHGYAADVLTLQEICNEHNLFMIEDCAQAHGATLGGQIIGSFGDVSAFSFYPTKNLGCIGDGGAVLTNNANTQKQIKTLRNYGIEDADINQVGLNSRLDELQAAFLNELLPHLNIYNNERISYALKYHEALKEFSEWLPPIIDGSVYHQFAMRIPSRDSFKSSMMESGIQLGEHYNFTMKNLSAFHKNCRKIPGAEKTATELISLPIQPEILDEHFDFIIDRLRKCLRKI